MTDIKELTKEQIEHYMRHFYGYGSWNGDYWFVGLEEGVGKSARRDQAKKDGVAEAIVVFNEKVKAFSHVYSELYCCPRNHLLDSAWFQGNLYPDYFKTKKHNNKRLTPQVTHKQLIRILNYIEKDRFLKHDNDTQLLQATAFGRHFPNQLPAHCAIELLPFPSPSRTNVDIIKQYKSEIPYFNTPRYQYDFKKEYERICFSEEIGRVSFLQKQIEKKKPKLVVFYAPEYFHSILNITQSKYRDWHILNLLSPSIIEHHSMAYWYNDKKTVFIIVNHPARCKNREYWECVCQRAKQLLINYKLLPKPESSPPQLSSNSAVSESV